jgi:hypothetical protein
MTMLTKALHRDQHERALAAALKGAAAGLVGSVALAAAVRGFVRLKALVLHGPRRTAIRWQPLPEEKA